MPTLPAYFPPDRARALLALSRRRTARARAAKAAAAALHTAGWHGDALAELVEIHVERRGVAA